MKNEVKEFLKWANKKYKNNLIEDIKILSLEEGVIANSYTDSRGFKTIGIGRNLDSNPLSFEEIHTLLMNDLILAHTNLYILRLGQPSDIRESALINMVFNLGLTRFQGFKKMIKALEAQDYKLAAAEIRDSKYWRDNDTHNRAERIAKMIETDKMDPYYEL